MRQSRKLVGPQGSREFESPPLHWIARFYRAFCLSAAGVCRRAFERAFAPSNTLEAPPFVLADLQAAAAAYFALDDATQRRVTNGWRVLPGPDQFQAYVNMERACEDAIIDVILQDGLTFGGGQRLALGDDCGTLCWRRGPELAHDDDDVTIRVAAVVRDDFDRIAGSGPGVAAYVGVARGPRPAQQKSQTPADVQPRLLGGEGAEVGTLRTLAVARYRRPPTFDNPSTPLRRPAPAGRSSCQLGARQGARQLPMRHPQFQPATAGQPRASANADAVFRFCANPLSTVAESP